MPVGCCRLNEAGHTRSWSHQRGRGGCCRKTKGECMLPKNEEFPCRFLSAGGAPASGQREKAVLANWSWGIQSPVGFIWRRIGRGPTPRLIISCTQLKPAILSNRSPSWTLGASLLRRRTGWQLFMGSCAKVRGHQDVGACEGTSGHA